MGENLENASTEQVQGDQTTGEEAGSAPAEESYQGGDKGSDTSTTPKEIDVEDSVGFDVEALLSDEDFEPEPEETPKEPEKKEDPKPEEPKQQDVPEKPKEPEVPKEAPKPEEIAQPAQPQAPQSPAEVQAPQSTQEVSTEQYEKFFNDSVELLAEKVYAFDEETAEKVDTEPSKVLPKLAATLHMQVMTAAVTQMANLMPGMMAQMQARQTTEKATEDKFFEEYPKLKGHADTIRQIGAVYRKLPGNEKKSYAEAAPEIAAMAMVQLRIPVDQQPAPVEQGTSPPPKPASASAPASRRSQPQAQDTEWDELVNLEE